MGSGPTDAHPTVPGSITRKLGLVTLAAFLLIVAIGGVSSSLAYTIFLGTRHTVREYQHIEVTEAIYTSLHHLIREVERAAIERSLDREARLRDRTRQVTDMLAVFLDGHQGSKDPFPEKAQEITLIRELQQAVGQLDAVAAQIMASMATNTPPRASEFQLTDAVADRIPRLVWQLNEIHQNKVRRLTATAARGMKVIVGAYVAFVLIGSLSVAVGIFFFSRTIAVPLRRLAQATQGVASGDFRKRVPVTVRDEIGQLAHDFNAMAEKLEEHEEGLKGLAVLEERERIAREMHDGLAQGLGFLLFRLRGPALQEVADAKAREALREMERVAQEAYTEVRQSIFGLRTMVTRGLGLIPTLAEYLHDFSIQSGIAIDLQVPHDAAVRLGPDAETQLVRVIQEAVTNVRRHAHARSAWVSFAVDGKDLQVVIGDDGRGFDLAGIQAQGRGHFGLQSMRERIQVVRGRFDIETAPGAGTRVSITLPILT